MLDNSYSQVVNNALTQLDNLTPDTNSMMNDLKFMRLSLKNKSGDLESLMQNKDQLIKHLWKLGKVHELMYKGLLKKDGSLTTQALIYLKNQRLGKLENDILPVSVVIDLFIETRKI